MIFFHEDGECGTLQARLQVDQPTAAAKKGDYQVAAPAELRDAQLVRSEQSLHKRVRMEGWRQRRMSSQEDHSTETTNPA